MTNISQSGLDVQRKEAPARVSPRPAADAATPSSGDAVDVGAPRERPVWDGKIPVSIGWNSDEPNPNVQVCPEWAFREPAAEKAPERPKWNGDIPVSMGWDSDEPNPNVQVCPDWAFGHGPIVATAPPVDISPTADAAPISALEKQAVVQGNNAFALDLFKAVSQDEKGNVFMSPFSVSTVMNQVRAGARGETSAEIARTLHLELPDNRVHRAYGSVMTGVVESVNVEVDGVKGVDMKLSNRIFPQAGYDVEPDFMAVTADSYGAAPESLNFAGSPEESRQHINAQVSKDTDEKIPELFPEGSINGDTRLAVTNAITFKGNWQAKFDPEATAAEPFHAPGETLNTLMMHQSGSFKLHQTNLDGTEFDPWSRQPAQLQVLELPFQGDKVVMNVLLPQDMAALDKALNTQNLESWLSAGNKGDVDVTMPKFDITGEYDLSQTLQNMGIQHAFNDADFSGINKDNLQLTTVIHKAHVACDEEGASFEAATGAAIGLESVQVTPQFTADRPFVYLIRDKDTNSILALGRVTNPSPNGGLEVEAPEAMGGGDVVLE